MSKHKNGYSKPWRGKFLSAFLVWCVVLSITIIALYLASQIVLFSIVGGVFVFSFVVPLFYANRHIQTKYRLSENVRLTTRIAVILTGTLLAPFILLFSFLFYTLLTGAPATSSYLGPLETTLLMNVVAPSVGACVGFFIVKNRTHFSPTA
jgi:hypothetical protein